MPGRRILYLSRWFPDPPDNGARLRAFSHLEALAETHDVTLLSFVEGGAASAATPFSRHCRRVATVPWRPYRPRSWRARTGFFGGAPRSLADTFSDEMRALVDAEIRAGSYDAAVVYTLDMTSYVPWLGSTPAIVDDPEVGLYRQALHSPSFAQSSRAKLRWAKLRRYLRRLLPRFAFATVTSADEARLLGEIAPEYGGVRVIENAVDATSADHVQRQPNLLVFAGALDYAPNREAMEWFCTRIFPRVRAEIPQAELAISGHPPRTPFDAPAGVRLLGHVDDVRALVASAAVSVAPIRRGGGTRLKILEAMALGAPVVATSKGAEGLEIIHGQHFLVADEEETFAAQVVRLLRDGDMGRRLARAAREVVRSRYDRRVVGRRFRELVDVAIETGAGRR